MIVPARDAGRTLPRTLDALARQELDGEYEVIVVDDGSVDATAQLARQAHGPVQVIEQAPLGPAAARNRGVAAARSPSLAFCDADVFPTPAWLRSGVECLERADVVQGRVLPDPEAALGPFDRSIWITSEVGLYETANLFVRRELFDSIGGFVEWIKPSRGKALAEDVWFGYRALRAGARSTFCDDALAYHAVFPRAWWAYATERLRLRYFPAMAAKMPELRRTFLHRGVFLNQRSAHFDLAMAGCVIAAGLGSPLPAVLALPYLRTLRWHARRFGGAGPGIAAVAAADVIADLVGLAAMLEGSARFGALII